MLKTAIFICDFNKQHQHLWPCADGFPQSGRDCSLLRTKSHRLNGDRHTHPRRETNEDNAARRKRAALKMQTQIMAQLRSRPDMESLSNYAPQTSRCLRAERSNTTRQYGGCCCCCSLLGGSSLPRGPTAGQPIWEASLLPLWSLLRREEEEEEVEADCRQEQRLFLGVDLMCGAVIKGLLLLFSSH